MHCQHFIYLLIHRNFVYSTLTTTFRIPAQNVIVYVLIWWLFLLIVVKWISQTLSTKCLLESNCFWLWVSLSSWHSIQKLQSQEKLYLYHLKVGQKLWCHYSGNLTHLTLHSIHRRASEGLQITWIPPNGCVQIAFRGIPINNILTWQ